MSRLFDAVAECMEGGKRKERHEMSNAKGGERRETERIENRYENEESREEE